MEIDSKIYHNLLRVRVCGIYVQNNRILLVRHSGVVPGKDFWSPPGGGLHFEETVHSCLKREFKEETGLEIKVGRFLFVNEFLKAPLHAIELFFEVSVIDGELKTGFDPEFTPETQQIQEVDYKTLSEVNAIPYAEKHSILHELVNFDDLFIPEHHFL